MPDVPSMGDLLTNPGPKFLTLGEAVENAVLCLECGAVVYAQDLHREWHASI